MDVPSDFHTYHFQNANVAGLDIEAKLGALLPKENAYVALDAISKKVVFRASDLQAGEIMALLRQWDTAPRQVHIEAEILSVNSTLIRQLGISWQAVLDRSNAGQESNRLTGEINFPPLLGDTANQGRLIVGDLGATDYLAVIQAITTDNDTEFIASPRILVREGEPANFSSTRDEPYTVVTVDGNTQTTLQDVRFLNLGTTLQVLPEINDEGLVTLRIYLEQSSLVEVRNGVPVADRSTAESVVSVKDGGTVVLAGLRQRSRKMGEEGVPGLRKVPLLGMLFKRNEKTRNDHELVLILRPVIFGPATEAAPTIAGVRDEVGQRAIEDNLGVIPE